MTTFPPPSAPTPGRRLWQARLRAGLSEAELGDPEFSARFVRAVERDRLHPSIPTWEWFADRLNLSLATLLGDAPPPVSGLTVLLDGDLAYQIVHARRVANAGDLAAGVALLNAAETMYTPRWTRFLPYTRYRLYFARAALYIRQGIPLRALPDLDRAGHLTADFKGGAQAAEQVRNARGAIFYQQERFGAALAEHQQCLRAVEAGVVQDWNLKLLIYSNVANDYLALNQIDAAINTYNAALALRDEVSNHERQAAIYWGLSLAHKTKSDLYRAKLYARQALDLYTLHGNPADAALMRVNMAELHIEWGEDKEAEGLLDAAIRFGEERQHNTVLSRAYEHKAHLALQQEALVQAADWAARSLAHIAAAQAADGAATVPAHMGRTYVRALRVAGLVAERRGDPTQAEIYFQRALAVADELGPSEAADELYTTYANVLSERGAHQAANTYLKALVNQRPRALAPVAS